MKLRVQVIMLPRDEGDALFAPSIIQRYPKLTLLVFQKLMLLYRLHGHFAIELPKRQDNQEEIELLRDIYFVQISHLHH